MMQLCFLIIVFLLVKGVLLQDVTLEPMSVDVLENSSIAFTCTTNGKISVWKINDVWPRIFYNTSDGTCQASGTLNNRKLYDWSCNQNGSFSLTILEVNRSQHGEKLLCSSQFWQNSNECTIKVKVPVETVAITNQIQNNITLLENIYELFTCNTSYSRPTPSVKWFVQSAGKSSQINKNSSDVISSDGKGFESVYSVLNISFDRTNQDAEIYCTGENGIGARTFSRNITLDIQYAPEGGPHIDETSNYTLKENSTFDITCTVPWGNPRPKLSWNCSGTQTSSFKEQIKIGVNLKWTAKRNEDKVCTCTSEQDIAGIQTAIIRTIVLYPPSIDSISFGQTALSQPIKVNKTIHVIENETYTLTCEANSKPGPTYKWTGLANLNYSTVEILNPQRRENYTETCHATNVMVFSDGETDTAEVNKSVKVNVLFPPKIDVMHDRRIIEGSDTNMTCPIILGNPSATNITWTRDFDDRHWLEQHFTIPNISRSDSMRYTCKAENTMVMTGNIKRKGSAMEFINLEVLYPPNRPKLVLLYISDVDVNITLSDKLSVAEDTPFTLVCEADSLPKPNLYSWNQMSLSNSSIYQSPGLRRDVKKHVTCKVRNTMISTEGTSRIGESDRTISLDIQFSPDIANIYDISLEEGTNVNVSCPVINGNPKETTVRWIRHDGGQQWIGANFTLENVSRTDSAIYTCRVNNTIIMTGGYRKEGQNNKSIELNVLYKVSILNYTAVNYTSNDNVTVAENETVNLICEIEGNPAPVGGIYMKKEIDIEKSPDGTFAVYSATFKATCSHKGIYSCRGTNYIKEKEKVSERNISLYVTCKPRPDPTFPMQRTIKVNIDKTIVLNFTVLAYPEPDTVLLKKYNGQSWATIGDDNKKFEIIKRGLDIKLTIHLMSSEDFGKYNIIIINEIGNYEHIFNVKQKAEKSTGTKPPKPAINYGLVVGLPVTIVLLISIIVVGIILYKRRHTSEPDKLLYQNVPFTGKVKKVKKTNETHHKEEAHSQELQEIDDVPHNETEPTEYYNSPEKIELIDRIKVSELYSYVSEKSNDSFGIDYQKLPSGMQKPCTFARKPENVALNRFNGIYPYDHSRVTIPGCPDFFINACYIDGYKRKKAYIASLGPTTKTTSDFKTFWQMVWHEETDVIVMLTNLNEPSGMKCEQYWPPDGTSIDYGEINVSSKSMKVFAEYTVQTFQITNNGKKRNLTHLHFTAWPDKTVPEDTACLLEFRRRMKTNSSSSKGPVIVHCSAGIGRTGTLIAIDILIEEGEDLDSVNVFGCVENMRNQRVKMVQTLEQYVYIYRTLANAFVSEGATISTGRLENYVTQTNDAYYTKLFKQISLSEEKDRKGDSDARTTNTRLINYNRKGTDVPGDRFRVMLYLERQSGNHNYINAVYINTFVKKDYLIIAQTPLPDTVEDFLSMLYCENCTCVVTMEDLSEPGTPIGQYMNDKQSLTFGKFTVFCSRIETKDQYIVRQLKIKYNGMADKKEKVMYHFQYTKWMLGREIPVNAMDFLQFIDKVEHYEKEFGEEESHVLVHCLRANERSGLFAAVKILKEKITEEKQVNVVNVLRRLRTRRPSAITCMEQVRFCYQAASAIAKINKR